MAIDIIARGLAASLVGENGKISIDKMPTLTGTENLSGFTSIGKLTDPSLIEGKTAEEILLMMLFGVVNPTLTAPSLKIALSKDMMQPIIGRPSLLKGTLTFDRGKIDPAHGTSGYRAGLPNSYSIGDIEIESSATFYDFSIEIIPTSDTIMLNYSVSYGAGEQPLDSVGKPFDKPLDSGIISAVLNITAVYPIYNADNEEHNFEWFEDEDGAGAGYLISLESENAEGAVRQSFAISSAATVKGIKAINPMTQQWDWLGGSAAASLTYFDTSIISGDVLEETTDYILYTYNSTPAGARDLKVYIE